MGSIFDVVRNHLAGGELEQAVVVVDNLLTGAEPNLQKSMLKEGRRLVGLGAQAARRPLEESLAARSRVRTDLLLYLVLLEKACAGLALPQVVAPAETPPDPAAEAHIDRREAKLPENPIRRIAWLEHGLKTARAVCKVFGKRATGTGFLLSNGRIVTNNHVLATPDDAAGPGVLFNYEEGLDSIPLQHVPYKLRPADFVTSVALDCTIVGVDATPGELARWGAIEIAGDAEPASLDSVTIIQHPDGGYKQIALSGSIVTSVEKPNYIYYETSTMNGSSGAPVLNDDWKVVALHRAAGQWWEARKRYVSNEGVRISAILADPQLAPFLALR
jgi:endonuclease G